MSTGAITRRQIIEDEALQWGETYAKNLDPVIQKNKEVIASIIAFVEANERLKSSPGQKEFIENMKRTREISEQVNVVWKEQNQLELALISTMRKNALATEGTNRALIKERTLLAETNKEL